MWAALAVSALLSAAPADAGALQIKNDRFTYGVFGQVRTDTQVLPGEIVFVAFDVEGLQTREDGTASYTTALELLDKSGKSLFKETPIERKALLPMGGNRLPNWSQVIVGSDTEPGTYTIRVTVADKLAKNSPPAVLEKKFELSAPHFGLIRTALFYDKPPTSPPPAPPIGVPGEGFIVGFTVVGFQTNPGAKAGDQAQAHVAVEMSILDDAGKPTLAKPFTIDVNQGLAEEYKAALPFSFPLAPNRAGKYTLVITATDKLANKSAKQQMSLTIVEPK